MKLSLRKKVLRQLIFLNYTLVQNYSMRTFSFVQFMIENLIRRKQFLFLYSPDFSHHAYTTTRHDFCNMGLKLRITLS